LIPEFAESLYCTHVLFIWKEVGLQVIEEKEKELIDCIAHNYSRIKGETPPSKFRNTRQQ
jgi:hypothetical protein